MVDFKKKLEELKAKKAAQIQTQLEIKIEEVSSIEAIALSDQNLQQTNPAGFLLKQKVEELNEAMLSAHPRMPVLLKEIWLAIRKQPEQVTVLSPEETHVIFQGIERQTGVFLATSVTESKNKAGTTSKMAALKKLGADAF